MKIYNNFCGNENIKYVFYNEWSDPELIYKGVTFSAPIIEGDLYNMMLEENLPDTQSQLAAYINNNIEWYLDECIIAADQAKAIF